MGSLYSRPHRGSIYEPATIHDIPQEVLEKSLLYLLCSVNVDLFSASMACRAWRPVAQKLIHSDFTVDCRNEGRIENLLCGYWLDSLVFGKSSLVRITTLSLDMLPSKNLNSLPISREIVALPRVQTQHF
jgi:hypothetical protein